MSSRKIKSERKQNLRKKNLGVGIGKIDIQEKSSEKTNKILFDDDFVASDYESNDEKNESAKSSEPLSDDESDGEIEQVSAATAKQQAMDMFAAERKTRKEESAVSHKRKRKTKDAPAASSPNASDDEEEEEDELDEDFFAAVDQERRMDAKAKKDRKGLTLTTIGKHTTFVSENDEIQAPTDVGNNIEVVVLPGLSSEEGAEEESNKHIVSSSAGLGTEPSATALLFCRGGQSLQESSQEKGFEVRRSRKSKYILARGRPLGNFKRMKNRS